MITVHDIDQFIHTLADRRTKESWDNVGLLCGRRGKPVRKVLIALDPFSGVCEEAALWGADVVLTHHPLIFQPVKAVSDDTEVGRCLLFLAEHGIAAINAHTNLDKAPEGVNTMLARRLGLTDIQVLNPEGADEKGNPIGLIRTGSFASCRPQEFAAHVRSALGCPGVRMVDGGKPVNRVAVGGGACGGALYEVAAAGCDTFVTADLKYNQFWDAKALGLTLIDAGHFYTENPVCTYLEEQLRARFPEIEVKISQCHKDCVEFL